MKIRKKISRHRSRSPKFAERSHSTLLHALQGTAKKCTKIYNARAQPLFYSLHLLFGGVFFTVVFSSGLLNFSNLQLSTREGYALITSRPPVVQILRHHFHASVVFSKSERWTVDFVA